MQETEKATGSIPELEGPLEQKATAHSSIRFHFQCRGTQVQSLVKEVSSAMQCDQKRTNKQSKQAIPLSSIKSAPLPRVRRGSEPDSVLTPQPTPATVSNTHVPELVTELW